MTITEAVNRCLMYGAGLRKVNSVTDTLAVRAQDVVLDTIRDFLTRGWTFNVDEIDLNRDVNNEIILPDGYLQVELPEPFVVRGGKIYDPVKRTYTLDQNFENSNVALLLTIEQLPEIAAQLIAWRATESFSVSTRSAASPQLPWVREQHNKASVAFSCEYPALIETNLSFTGGFGRGFGYGSSVRRWCSCG